MLDKTLTNLFKLITASNLVLNMNQKKALDSIKALISSHKKTAPADAKKTLTTSLDIIETSMQPQSKSQTNAPEPTHQAAPGHHQVGQVYHQMLNTKTTNEPLIAFYQMPPKKVKLADKLIGRTNHTTTR